MSSPTVERSPRGEQRTLNLVTRVDVFAFQATAPAALQGLSERMMGLEPTTFCMGVRAMFAAVRPGKVKPLSCSVFIRASERGRTRANVEPCHSCHAWISLDGGQAPARPRAPARVPSAYAAAPSPSPPEYRTAG
jgi:hypothetical protein